MLSSFWGYVNRQEHVWDAIAPEWDSYRKAPLLREAEDCAKKWTPGTLLDVGCGNGRNAQPFVKNGFVVTGVDSSKEMLKFAQKNIAKTVLASASNLPFSDASFEYVLCIAALHHVEKEKQVAAINELYRVLKPGGRALFTVWNKLQFRFVFGKNERLIPWRLRSGEILPRFYYFFTPWEFTRAVKRAGFSAKRISGLFERNVVIIAEKPSTLS